MNVLVTGASAGFGAAMVRKFASSGDFRVIAAGRRLDLLKALQAECGPRVLPLELDVRDPKRVEEALSSLPAEFAPVDVLINNAGLALGIDPAQKAKVSDWQTMVDTNINGLLYCTNAVLAGMVERNRGHIINLGSVAGEFPYPGGNVYGASKAFVHQFSLNLRADLLGTQVRVTCIEPGMCDGTEFSKVRFGGDVKKAEAVYAGVRALSAEDIAETVYWVASRPAHVNINVISMMPVQQAFSPFAVSREK
jgi:3-hydroxy acid dehydrogenase/malonic semialdehyde reductase